MEPSAYQQAIYQWIETGRGDAVVNAVAGSGKTTTIVHAASLVQGSGLFLAFNKPIAVELSKRLPRHMPAATLHSVGFGVLRANSRTRYKVDSDDNKYTRLAYDYADRQYPHWRQDRDEREARAELVRTCRAMVDKTRVTLTDPRDRNALADMARHYGIIATPEALDAVPRLLQDGQAQARAGLIDFTDMLYLPHVWQLKPNPVQWLMVDECQDLSAAQLSLVLKLRAPGGRIIFVGDRNQAIYGFAGADAQSFDNIIAATNATQLPLSICYRCPRTHIDLAQAIVPTIEPRPDAPDGTVDAIDADKLGASVGEGDLILCRLTAPLISTCIQLIGQKIPARVRGRDVARQLAATVHEICDQPGFTWSQFNSASDAYRARQATKLTKRGPNDAALSSLDDRLAGIHAVADAYEVQSADELCSAIESLFADDRASVWLSTVHRAKGLEADNVYILRPEKMPLSYPNQQPWEAEQEHNILYVALTRAKKSLTYVLTEQAPTAPATTVTEPTETPQELALAIA